MTRAQLSALIETIREEKGGDRPQSVRDMAAEIGVSSSMAQALRDGSRCPGVATCFALEKWSGGRIVAVEAMQIVVTDPAPSSASSDLDDPAPPSAQAAPHPDTPHPTDAAEAA